VPVATESTGRWIRSDAFFPDSTESELAEASGDLLENTVAVQSRLMIDRGDALLGRPDVRDKRVNPAGGPRVPREVIPRWVDLVPHPAILSYLLGETRAN